VVLARNCLLSQGADPRTLSVFITSKVKLFQHTAAAARCVGCHFLNYVRMRTRLVPRPQIVALGLRTQLAHVISVGTS